MSQVAALARLYAFHGGGDFCDLAIADPFDPCVGTKAYEPWFYYVLRHPGGVLLFDTGVHPELIADPTSRLGSWADVLDMRMSPGDDVVSQLNSIGLTPGDVDVVVPSHLHFDHVSALELFRHARIIVQRNELAYARDPSVYQAGSYSQADFAGDYNWQVIDGFLDVFGDGTVEVVPTPGHTPGSQSLLVHLTQENLLLIGDATYQLEKMRARLIQSLTWSPEAVVSSWNLIEWLEKRENATIFCSHDSQFESRVKLGPEEWYE